MMSKKPLLMQALALVVLMAGCPLSGSAQCIRQDETPVFRTTDNGVYNLYDENAPKFITPVPKGYKAVGISHYGRHGSRYYTGTRFKMAQLEETLVRAENEGILSERGKQILHSYQAILPAISHREGELTQLGRRQHEGIAERMYRQYPGLFTREATVTAWCTLVPRCMESMAAFCEQLARLAPKTPIEEEASARYLGQVSATQEYFLWYNVSSKKPIAALRAPSYNSIDPTSLRDALFTRPILPEKEMRDFTAGLWYIYMSIPGSDIRDTPQACAFRYAVDGKACEAGPGMAPIISDSLWDQLQYAELYTHLSEACGPVLHHSTLNIFMVEAILKLADEDLQGGKPFARLRFGHDTIIMAILKDMGIRGWRKWEACDTLSQEQARKKTEAEWNTSRVPMASNLQMIFYRPKDARSQAPVLFKLMLNESELELPIEAVSGRIYDWETFKAYMAPRIEKGKAEALPYLKYPYPIYTQY